MLYNNKKLVILQLLTYIFLNLKLFSVTVMLLKVIASDANIGFMVNPHTENTPMAIGNIQIL